MRRIVTILIVFTTSLIAQWGQPPANWDDFQIGIVNNDRVEWDTPMKAALNAGYHLDRRYIYIDNLIDVTTFWGTSPAGGSKNWSKNSFYVDKGVGPAIIIYMLQRGGDSYDILSSNIQDQSFMKQYFEAIVQIADSSKGMRPIYVLEPDVWGYVLQHAREHNGIGLDSFSQITDNHLDAPCHLNNLGLPWLTEFENKLSNLPGAIIKTVKEVDPECYAGILMAFWAWKPNNCTKLMIFKNSQEKIDEAACEEAAFCEALLSSTKYRGDFLGVEKNGTDMGYWYVLDKITGWDTLQGGIFARGPMYDWNDEDNSQWVDLSKYIARKVDLPLLGWQISLGHMGLPNVDNRYEDTFFPYFFDHVQEFIQAGFIGMLSGCANQGRGTIACIDQNSGDSGWFYGKLNVFDEKRPYDLTITTPLLKGVPVSSIPCITVKLRGRFLHVVDAPEGKSTLNLYTAAGRRVAEYNAHKGALLPIAHLPAGMYIMSVSRDGLTWTEKLTIQR